MSFAPLLGDGVETVIIYVRHKDVFTGKDSILGYASIPMSTYYNAPKVEIDAWYDLLNAGESREIGEHLGKIRTRITYFNELDDDLVETAGDQGKPKAPNLLEVVVIDGKDFSGGQAVEPFVIIQCGDLRKETKSSKKSKTPTWNDTIQIPVVDGNEVIDITVKNTTVVRSIFLGRIRIPLNEVAAAGEMGLRKAYTLLNENLVFEGAGNGFLQMKICWFFDKATDDENKRVKATKMGMLSRLAGLLPFRKAVKKEDEEEKKDEEKKEEEEDNDDDNMGDMTPYEYAMWLEEQRRNRREELKDLLEVPEFELDFRDGDYSIQVQIVEVMDLVGKDYSGMSDPYVAIEVLGIKKKTRFQKQVNSCVFDETFYFNFEGLKKEQVAEGSMRLTVKDHNYFWFDGMIGIYQVDLMTVYGKRDHEIWRKWGALRDPLSKEDSGVQGLVKFSCTVLGPGDIQKIHDPVNEVGVWRRSPAIVSCNCQLQ